MTTVASQFEANSTSEFGVLFAVITAYDMRDMDWHLWRHNIGFSILLFLLEQ